MTDESSRLDTIFAVLTDDGKTARDLPDSLDELRRVLERDAARKAGHETQRETRDRTRYGTVLCPLFQGDR